jgi:prepilin-type N-terminal cleavage/methylation domain-containing protein
MAAGVEMDPTRVDLLRAALNRAILRDPAEMAPETEVDAEVRLSDLTLETLAELALLEPHGHGNPEPTFISRNVTVAGEPRTMGDRGQHLSFYARQDRTVARAVAFGRGAEAEPLRRNGAQVTLVYRPRLSRWQVPKSSSSTYWTSSKSSRLARKAAPFPESQANCPIYDLGLISFGELRESAERLAPRNVTMTKTGKAQLGQREDVDGSTAGNSGGNSTTNSGQTKELPEKTKELTDAGICLAEIEVKLEIRAQRCRNTKCALLCARRVLGLSRRKGSMKRNEGFTLIELMIVVAIIAIIAAIAIPSLLNARKAGNEASAISSCRTLCTVNEQYRTRFQAYTSSLANLKHDGLHRQRALFGHEVGVRLHVRWQHEHVVGQRCRRRRLARR